MSSESCLTHDPYCGGRCHSGYLGLCSSYVNLFFSVTDVTPATFETPEVHPGGLPLGNKSKAGIKAAEEGRGIMFL